MARTNANATSSDAQKAGFGEVIVRTDHETWDDAASIGAEEPKYMDDVAGEGYGMLESIPGFYRNAENSEGLRAPVTGPLITASPWAWILRLSASYEDGSKAVYTGWLAAPRVVVTNGCCLFDPSRGIAREVLVEAAAGLRPVKSSEFRMVNGWVNGAKRDCDYGAVILPEAGLKRVGHFGVAWLPGTRPTNEWLNLAGYSSDEIDDTQWYEGLKVANADDKFLRRTGGFNGSTAGSPLWLYMVRNGQAHRYVCGMVGSDANNGDAIRIYHDVYNSLSNWIAEASTVPGGGAGRAAAAGEQGAQIG